MKVICTSPSFAKYDDAPISALKEADLELVMLPADASIEMLAQHLPDTIAMIVAFTDINESLLEKAPRLKIVCKHGVGVDGLAPIFPYTFYHLTHDWFVAADIPV
ncbi:hypothetical protein POV14_20705, partial [Klebsiella variicola]